MQPVKSNEIISVYTRKKPFYGWYIVIVSFFAFFIGAGTSADILTVLLKPMSEDLGWTRTAMMGAFTVTTVVGAIVSPFIGRIIDQHGTRISMTLSALAAGALLLTISLATELWQFYLLFGVGIGLTRPGLASLAAPTAVSNWFIKKRGRALAIATMGMGLSALVLIPLATYIVTSFDWKKVWLVLGLMTWLLVALPALLVMKRRPEDIGLLPDGELILVNDGLQKSQCETAEIFEYDWEAEEAIKTRAFWLITASIVLTGLSMLGIFLHVLANFTDKGIAPTMASFAIASLTLTSLPFRLFWGFLAERFSIRHCLIIINLGSVITTVLLMKATTFPAACGSMLFWGVFLGGSLSLQIQIWDSYFGRMAIGKIRGYAAPFQVIGVALGPLFAGWIFDTTGSYDLAFLIFAAAYLFAALTIYLARPPSLPSRH